MKKVLALIVMMCMLCGCSSTKVVKDNKMPLDFTVVTKKDIPTELFTIIEEKQTEEFTMSYTLDGYLYIAVGYGKQDTGGYSIQVEELYETESNIGINTTLVGPQAGEAVNKMATYPYVVVKTEYIDKNIIFE